MITELICIKEQIKVYHWQTHSFSQHFALDRIYGEMNDLVDKFVEVFLGKNGRFDPDKSIVLTLNPKVETVNQFLEQTITFLISLTQLLDAQKDSDLLNIRDEMLGTMNQLKYLLSLE